MEGTGLDEIRATVYARKTLPQIIEAKAYTRSLRACLLTYATLHLTLLNPKPNDTGVDADDEDGPRQPEDDTE